MTYIYIYIIERERDIYVCIYIYIYIYVCRAVGARRRGSRCGLVHYYVLLCYCVLIVAMCLCVIMPYYVIVFLLLPCFRAAFAPSCHCGIAAACLVGLLVRLSRCLVDRCCFVCYLKSYMFTLMFICFV